MPDTPERPIEQALRAFSAKRRQEAGWPLELHPANRRLLQDEVARVWGRPAAPRRQPSGWWQALATLWPRAALATVLAAALGMGGWWLWLREQTPMQLAQQSAPGPSPSDSLTRNEPALQEQLPAWPAPAPTPNASVSDRGVAEPPGTETLVRQTADRAALAGAEMRQETVIQGEAQTVGRKMAAGPQTTSAARALASRPPTPPPAAAITGSPLAQAESVLAATAEPPRAAEPAPVDPAKATRPLPAPHETLLAGSAGQSEGGLGLRGRGASLDSTALVLTNGVGSDSTAQTSPAAAESNLRALQTAAKKAVRAEFTQPSGLIGAPEKAVASPALSATPAAPEAPSAAKQSSVFPAEEAQAHLSDGLLPEGKRLWFEQRPAPEAAAARASTPATPRVLRAFHLERRGNEIRVVDQDGSVYSGQVLDDRPGREQAPALRRQSGEANAVGGRDLSFTASGTNRTVGQWVQVLATLQESPSGKDLAGAQREAAAEAARPRVALERQPTPAGRASQSSRAFTLRLVGQVRWGNNEVLIDAVQSTPP